MPAKREYSRNSMDTSTHTVWEPMSSRQVLQHPSRKKPVTGSVLQGSSVPPRTLIASSFVIWFIMSARAVALRPSLNSDGFDSAFKFRKWQFVRCLWCRSGNNSRTGSRCKNGNTTIVISYGDSASFCDHNFKSI